VRHPSTPADRVPWVAAVVAHRGVYGVATAVSRRSGVPRQTLYRWADRGRAALEQASAPPPPAAGPPDLARAVLTLLAEGHASYRGIQACLAALLGWRVRLEAIVAVVGEAGERARAWLAERVPPQPVALALDECYGGDRHRAYLSAVAVPSGAVWAVAAGVAPDAASWADLLRAGQARGLRWHSAVHDGGHAAPAGCAAVAPDALLVRDVWHALDRCAEAQARLARAAAAAWERWVTVTAYEEAVAAGQRPKGRAPTTTAAAQAAQVVAAERTAADVAYLTDEVRRLLAVVVVRRGRLLTAAERRADLEAALALLDGVASAAPAPQQAEVARLRAHLAQAGDGLLAWAPGLDAVQGAMAAVLGEAGVALVGWGWRHRDEFGWTGDEVVAALPEHWRPAARVLVAAWAGVARASSAVEGWHSVLRPHLAVHRRLSPGLLALLAVCHNHRVAPRGLHRGTSPLQRSGLGTAPADWLVALGYPPAAAPAAVTPAPKEERMAA
jgi:hypothetical protein